MNKEIKVTLKSKTQLRIEEPAEQGDYIDINSLEHSLDSTTISNIFSKIKDEGTEKEVQKRILEREKSLNETFEAKLNEEKQKVVSDKDNKILKLESVIKELENSKNIVEKKAELEISKQYEEKIISLNKEITKKESEISSAQDKIKSEKDAVIADLITKFSVAEEKLKHYDTDKKLAVKEIENKLTLKEEEIAELRRNKNSLNTKVLGEELEKWTSNEFDTFFGYSDTMKFEKYGKTNENGTKGDFILTCFSDPTSKIEILKIVIECKNEFFNSTNKKKNAEHLDKLVKDRDMVHASIGILLTELEINDKFDIKGAGHEYDNIYICRPSSFIALINILVTSAYKNSNSIIETKKMEFNFGDKQKFLENMQKFKNDIQVSIEKIITKRESINKIADGLEKQAAELREANRLVFVHFGTLESKIEALTLRKLTSNKKLNEDKIFDNSEDIENNKNK
jgi:hypothetical protein